MSTASPTPGRLVLPDGRVVHLRPADPDDVPALVDLLTGLGEASARTRFLGARPPESLLRDVVAVRDGVLAVVAVLAEADADADADAPSGTGGAIVGEARCLPREDGAGELAVTVADALHGGGIGRRLVAEIARRAAAAGVDRLHAEVLVTNGAMLALLGEYGWVLTEPTAECVAHVEISTRGGVPGWGPVAPGTRRVLVEGGSWFDDATTRRWRATGAEVRSCLGHRPGAGRACPLLTGAGCRLVDEADVVVPRFRPGARGAEEILAEHRRRRPERLDPPLP